MVCGGCLAKLLDSVLRIEAYKVVVAGGMAPDSGAAKTGTGGGRGGVAGGAFSLSVADEWPGAAGVWGVGASASASASASAGLVSTGGLGNSWMIWARQSRAACGRCGRRTSSRRSRMNCSVCGHSALREQVSGARCECDCGEHSRVQRAIVGGLLQDGLRCELSARGVEAAGVWRATYRRPCRGGQAGGRSLRSGGVRSAVTAMLERETAPLQARSTDTTRASDSLRHSTATRRPALGRLAAAGGDCGRLTG